MIEESTDSLEATFVKGTWRCSHGSGQWGFPHFTPASLHPWHSRNEWPPHVLGTALWGHKQHIDGLIAQSHDIISCESEGACSPPFFFFFFILWSKGLSNGLRFKTSRLACGSHRTFPPVPSFLLWLGVWASQTALGSLQKDSANCSFPSLCIPPERNSYFKWQARCSVFYFKNLPYKYALLGISKRLLSVPPFCQELLICDPHGLRQVS